MNFFHVYSFIFSRMEIRRNFHGQFHIFTHRKPKNFTDRFAFLRTENQKFSRMGKFFSRTKKKHWGGKGGGKGKLASRPRNCEKQSDKIARKEKISSR